MARTNATKPAREAAEAVGRDLIGQAPQTPSCQQAVPTLRISNYRLSRAFYTVLLGFRIDWERSFDPEMAVLAQVSRDGMVLLLTEHAGDCEAGALVHVFVPDVDALYAELRGRGTPVQEAPHVGIEGRRVMTLLDPDGNRFRICAKSTSSLSSTDRRRGP
jgi:catechol 2,3-dioxygenase-like lactoylglutathione lyase family enzyme